MINRLDEQEFMKLKSFVIDDVKDSSNKEVFEYLHESLDLWLYVLQTLRREVELQLSCQNSKLKMDIYGVKNSNTVSDIAEEYNLQNEIVNLRIKHHKWRMSVLKFLTNIENKTLYVKMLISNRNTLTA